MPALRFKPQPRVGAISLETINRFRPTLAVWAVGAGGAVALFLSSVPLFQHDILQKIPVVSTYFTDKTPDSDKPF